MKCPIQKSMFRNCNMSRPHTHQTKIQNIPQNKNFVSVIFKRKTPSNWTYGSIRRLYEKCSRIIFFETKSGSYRAVNKIT